MILHRFTLAKVYPTSPGIMKICQFNPNAKDFVTKFLYDNKELLVTAIRASAAYRFDKMQIQIRETKSQKKKSMDASHGSSASKSASATKSAGNTPPKDEKKKTRRARSKEEPKTLSVAMRPSESSFTVPKNTSPT
jgi:hypothetical protein